MNLRIGPSVPPCVFPARAAEVPPDNLRVAVDLSGPWTGIGDALSKRIQQGLRSTGADGGQSITFIYLTSDLSHQAALALARPQDELLCVRLLCTATLVALTNRGNREDLWLLPPADLLIQLRADAFYSPAGDVTYACPGIPTIVGQSPPDQAAEAARIEARIVAPDSDLLPAFRAASTRHDMLWHKGIGNDGWIESTAVVALPHIDAPARLEIHTAAISAPRRLRLYRGLVPFGGFALPAGQTHTASVVMIPEARPLVIQIPDAANLDLADPRRHGIRLTGIQLIREDSPVIGLY